MMKITDFILSSVVLSSLLLFSTDLTAGPNDIWEVTKDSCSIFALSPAQKWEAYSGKLSVGQRVTEADVNDANARPDLIHFKIAPEDAQLLLTWRNCFRKIEFSATPLAPVEPLPSQSPQPNFVTPEAQNLAPQQSIASLNEEKTASKRWKFGRQQLNFGIGFINWYEQVNAKLSSGQTSKVNVTAYGVNPGMGYNILLRDRFDLGGDLSAGFAKSSLKDDGSVSGFVYDVKNANTYFLILGPHALWRSPSKMYGVGLKIPMIYRKASWPGGSTYSVSDQSSFFVTGAATGRVEYKSFALDTTVGFFKSITEPYWSLDISYLFNL